MYTHKNVLRSCNYFGSNASVANASNLHLVRLVERSVGDIVNYLVLLALRFNNRQQSLGCVEMRSMFLSTARACECLCVSVTHCTSKTVDRFS